ncbi:MAG: F0F1 ATP synthase subunit A, partial [Myxococcota bacterium]
MADKTILSLIPGFDEAMKSAGTALAHANASLMNALGFHAEHGEHLHPLNTTSMVLLTFVLGFVLVMVFLAKSRLAPEEKAIVPDDSLTPRTFVELIFDTVFGLMSDMMGRNNARRFFPLIATCALVILFSNLLGLLPGMAPPTDNLNLNAAMASVIFIATHVVGFQTNGIAHFSHMANPSGEWWGWFLAPLMLPIELIGHVVRPVSLSLRLMCNMI